MPGCVSDRVRDRLVEWLVAWLKEWEIGWQSDWMPACVNYRVRDRLSEWLVAWLKAWEIGWQSDWLAEWMKDWETGWLSGRLERWYDWTVGMIIRLQDLLPGVYISNHSAINHSCCGTRTFITVRTGVRNLTIFWDTSANISQFIQISPISALCPPTYTSVYGPVQL
jgi:hypothetical protein